MNLQTQVFFSLLKPPKEQPRTLSGLERRDGLFSLRGIRDGWEELRKEFEANFLLCEFKNYSEVILDRCLEKDRIFLGEICNALGSSKRG